MIDKYISVIGERNGAEGPLALPWRETAAVVPPVGAFAQNSFFLSEPLRNTGECAKLVCPNLKSFLAIHGCNESCASGSRMLSLRTHDLLGAKVCIQF